MFTRSKDTDFWPKELILNHCASSKEIKDDLRKLIKYEESMGVNTHQDNYFEGLFRRTTASYRAKLGKENIRKGSIPKRRTNAHDDDYDDDMPTTSKKAQCRQRTLQDRNRQREADSTTTTDNSLDTKPSKPKIAKQSHGTSHDSIKKFVEDIVAQILQDKFTNSHKKNNHNCASNGDGHKITIMDPVSMKSVVADLVNRILKEKLTGQRDVNDSFGTKPLKSTIEDIVTEKLKEHLANLPNVCKKKENVENLNHEMQEKLHLSKDRRPLFSNPNNTIESEILMAELLADNDPKSKSKKITAPNQRSPKSRCQTPEWQQLSGEKAPGVIRRLPRSQVKDPEWQETDGKTKPRSTSARKDGRARSPAPSLSGRSSRSHLKETGVLIRRPTSQGRSNKPNNSDPVALYQYYKNEWEHFRKQIPGETNHNRLRWHVRQRLLDPE